MIRIYKNMEQQITDNKDEDFIIDLQPEVGKDYYYKKDDNNWYKSKFKKIQTEEKFNIKNIYYVMENDISDITVSSLYALKKDMSQPKFSQEYSKIQLNGNLYYLYEPNYDESGKLVFKKGIIQSIVKPLDNTKMKFVMVNGDTTDTVYNNYLDYPNLYVSSELLEEKDKLKKYRIELNTDKDYHYNPFTDQYRRLVFNKYAKIIRVEQDKDPYKTFLFVMDNDDKLELLYSIDDDNVQSGGKRSDKKRSDKKRSDKKRSDKKPRKQKHRVRKSRRNRRR